MAEFTNLHHPGPCCIHTGLVHELFLPVMHMRDCGRPVPKDPALDVHGTGFGIGNGNINHPLQAPPFAFCEQTQGLCE